MIEKLENAIIIGGTVYELVDVEKDCDECDTCDLKDYCINIVPTCVLFDDPIGKHFKERTDL